VLGEQSENQPLISVLQNRFGETVQSLDPFAYSEVSVETDIATGNRALYSGPIGALLGQTAEQISVVDFLNPRKAIVDRDRRALKLSLIAAGVLLLISAVYGYRYWKIADLDSQIAEMKVEIKSLDTSLKKVAPNLVSAELVQKWIDQKVDWLEHTKRLTEAMQGIEQYYLTDLSFSRGLRGSQGTINATGAAKSRGDVERLYAKISAVTGFEIRPNPITRNGRDREYPYEFHLEVDLKPVQEKTKQTTSGAAGGNS
jgi:Tfp pilus assembly protein PilN